MLLKQHEHLSISSVLLESFTKAHGTKYSYEASVYCGAHTPIEITCPEHGIFRQSPTAHRNGQGCPECALESKKAKKTLSQESVLAAFELRHGNKYDYSQVVYKNGHEKITIVCPKHGAFEQTPNAHKNGQGCPRCSGRGKTKEELLEEFRGIHGDRYDYTRVDWVNAITKVVIGCREHGDFLQTPNSHLQGRGCRLCALDERLKNLKNKQ